MVPMLPCGDIDEMAAFWTALGLEDAQGAREAIDQVTALARLTDLTPADRNAIERAVREVAEL